jgi:hypothetical protein
LLLNADWKGWGEGGGRLGVGLGRTTSRIAPRLIFLLVLFKQSKVQASSSIENNNLQILVVNNRN